MASVDEIGKQLVELCQRHKNLEAIDALYHPDAVSVEPMGGPDMPAESKGRDAIKAKNEWWVANHDVHNDTTKGPFPHGDRFAVIYAMEFTPKIGPHAGKRVNMEEVALYTVADGKIVREEFFYTMG
jgi:ketosteroid isomerase-like protein